MIKKAIVVVSLIQLLIFNAFSQTQKIDSLKTVIEEGSDTTKLNAYTTLSSLYQDIDLEKAQTYLHKIDSLKEKINKPKHDAQVFHHYGGYYYKTGEYDKALESYRKALRIYKKNKNRNRIASTANNIGLVFEKKGEYEKALEYLLKALSIQEKINAKEDLARNYLNIGLINMRIGNYKKALEYYEKSQKLRIQLDDKEGLALVYNNMAILYYHMGEYANVRSYFEKAYRIYKEEGNKRKQAMTLSNLGEIYALIGKHEKALSAYYECAEIEKKLQDKNGLIGTYGMIARVLRKRNQNDRALSYLKKGLKLAEEINSQSQLKEIYRELYATFKAKNNHSEALHWHEKYFAMHDSIFNATKNKQLNELQTKYETEKKEQKIKLLNKEKKVQELKLKKQRYFSLFLIIILLVIATFAFALLFQKRKIMAANRKLAYQQKQITDSITYASRIQNAILPTKAQIESIFRDAYFILFKPKELVSGDFYYANQKNQKKIIASIDCTGHGVPGAFMSMLGFSFLNEIISTSNNIKANEILDALRENVIEALHQKQEIGTGKDGMDIALCVIDEQNQQIEFSGAYQNMLYVSNGEIHRYKGDKMPIGIHYKENIPFTSEHIKYNPGDSIYLFSDGYIDQFGGEHNKKFRLKNFEHLLANIEDHSLTERKRILAETIEKWKGDQHQLDDIMVIGLQL